MVSPAHPHPQLPLAPALSTSSLNKILWSFRGPREDLSGQVPTLLEARLLLPTRPPGTSAVSRRGSGPPALPSPRARRLRGIK